MSTLFSVGRIAIKANFMNEMKEVNDELLVQLSQMQYTCMRPIVLADNGRHFVEMLEELQDQLALYFALEEAYSIPLETSPHTPFEAEEPRREHRQLYAQLAHIVEKAAAMLNRGERIQLAADIPPLFLAFHEQLSDHDHRENELRTAPLYNDTGAGD